MAMQQAEEKEAAKEATTKKKRAREEEAGAKAALSNGSKASKKSAKPKSKVETKKPTKKKKADAEDEEGGGEEEEAAEPNTEDEYGGDDYEEPEVVGDVEDDPSLMYRALRGSAVGTESSSVLPPGAISECDPRSQLIAKKGGLVWHILPAAWVKDVVMYHGGPARVMHYVDKWKSMMDVDKSINKDLWEAHVDACHIMTLNEDTLNKVVFTRRADCCAAMFIMWCRHENLKRLIIRGPIGEGSTTPTTKDGVTIGKPLGVTMKEFLCISYKVTLGKTTKPARGQQPTCDMTVLAQQKRTKPGSIITCILHRLQTRDVQTAPQHQEFAQQPTLKVNINKAGLKGLQAAVAALTVNHATVYLNDEATTPSKTPVTAESRRRYLYDKPAGDLDSISRSDKMRFYHNLMTSYAVRVFGYQIVDNLIP